MDNDFLVGKLATIERCCKRARDEYEKDPTTFVGDVTRQDAATLNVIRAWEAIVELGDAMLADSGADPAWDEREVITLLVDKGWIDAALGEDLKRTGEFCRAEWDRQAAPLPALVAIIKRGLDDVEAAGRALAAQGAGAGAGDSDDADDAGATSATTVDEP